MWFILQNKKYKRQKMDNFEHTLHCNKKDCWYSRKEKTERLLPFDFGKDAFAFLFTIEMAHHVLTCPSTPWGKAKIKFGKMNELVG